MKYLPWVERGVEAQLRKRGIRMIKHGPGYQKWEETANGERRFLSVFFMRSPEGGPFGDWKSKQTDEVVEAAIPKHPHLFVVVGGTVHDEGREDVYVSGPILKLPSLVEAPAGTHLGHLMREKHSLRHGPRLETCVVSTLRGTELRAVG